VEKLAWLRKRGRVESRLYDSCPSVTARDCGRRTRTSSAAITGVAGSPTDGNPIGVARIAIARRGSAVSSMQKNDGDVGRDGVRERVLDALVA
jgi:nicotinamide mononucleotide (NMN) deamidase PncC